MWVDHMVDAEDKGYDIPLLVATLWGLVGWYYLLNNNPMHVSEYLMNHGNGVLSIVGLLTFMPEMLAMGWVIIALPGIAMKGLSAFKK